MKPEQKSHLLLGVTRSAAKMLEYGVPEEHKIKIVKDPAKLFTLSIGLLGDVAAGINRDEVNLESISELRDNLIFSARFFDAYLQAKLNESLDPYLALLAAASYYLCDLPGSASVLAKSIPPDCPDLKVEGLEDLLLWLLQADLSVYFDGFQGPWGSYVDQVSVGVLNYYREGDGEKRLLELVNQLRDAVYRSGTPRQLLFGDVIAAVLKKKIQNSSWKALPLYSALPRESWNDALKKSTFIKELWPAQHLLGLANVLKGDSAIIQMPTSAGKTKATELVLRSAFLAGRAQLAVIVAPFRALCHEIKNDLIVAFKGELTKVDELSDSLQTDFDIAALLGHHQVLVVTPEKILYVLRQSPELASQIGLIIFDEGHQFDSGSRGITYELLLTSLRSMLPLEAQKLLISAVISNAEAIGGWLNGDPKAVDGHDLIPTYRSVAFASFKDLRGAPIRVGWMKYVNPQSPSSLEYFVPQVIAPIILERKKGESLTIRKEFPESADGKDIAVFLGLKLVEKGPVAIFCGRKDTASGLCDMLVERFSRNLPLQPPRAFSVKPESDRLHYLIELNLGPSSSSAQGAKLGVFSHHGNTPHGIRLAVEDAMRKEHIRFVVCTSTLAQGVNLPIRYLIVTSVYQGRERIKVRDFHNLIGRAGRAGMHTEGSVLFADPIVHDGKSDREEQWRWKQVEELLEPQNSEPCISSLLSIFDPIKSDYGNQVIALEALAFAQAYLNDPVKVSKFAERVAALHKDKGFTEEGVARQVARRISLICGVESFLMSYSDEAGTNLSEAGVIALCEQTLAFFLANEQVRVHIRDLFKLLAANILVKVPNPPLRLIYGRTLYGLLDAQSIDAWVHANAEPLLSIDSDEDVLDLVWPLIAANIHNGVFRKCDKPEVLKEVAQAWIDGQPFHELFAIIGKREARMFWGKTKRRDFKIDHVVEICEGGLAHDGGLLLGAVCEFVRNLGREEADNAIKWIQVFQKRLKYGLPTDVTIAIYELGFSDRVIAQDLVGVLEATEAGRKAVIKRFKGRIGEAKSCLERYPSYFQDRLNALLNI
jgi:POLQ-like helicase